MIKAKKKAAKKVAKRIKKKPTMLQRLAALPWVESVKHEAVPNYHGDVPLRSWYCLETKEGMLRRKVSYKFSSDVIKDTVSKLAKPYFAKQPRLRLYIVKEIVDFDDDDEREWQLYVELLDIPKNKPRYIVPCVTIGRITYDRRRQIYNVCIGGEWYSDFHNCKNVVQCAEMVALYLQTAKQMGDGEDKESGKWAHYNGL